MSEKRFFIQIPLEINQTVLLKDEYFNYIVNVMRLKEGTSIIINNNTEYDFLCKITEVNKKTLTLLVLNKTINENESKISTTLCQALVKAEKTELITQKIVELGLNKLIPFTSEFTVVKDNTQKLERLNKISEQASSQCGRSKTLQVAPITTLKNLPQLLKEYDLVLLAYEKATKPLKEVLNSFLNLKNVALIVGSEGGFSETEVSYLQNELKNLKVVSLGNRILRAETAGIVLSAITMYELGELS